MNHYRNILFSALLWLFASGNASASHMMGADLSYKSLGKDSFLITLKVYRDCNGVSLSNTPLSITPMGCSASTTTISMTQKSLKDITNLCGGTLSKCAGGSFAYGVEEYTFECIVRTSIYGSSCCQVRLSWEQQARNGAITTGQADQNFYTYAIIDRCAAPYNNSPSLLNKPVGFVCAGKDLSFNNGVMDTLDGDSLGYELAEPLQGWGSPCQYANGYSKLKPLGFLAFPNHNAPLPAGFHLDSITGDLAFRPTTQQVAVVVIQINEWRKINGTYVKIGETRRDMQLIITSSTANCSNSPPSLPTIVTKQVCVGQKLTFNITPTDPNPTDTVILLWNKGIKGATFTNNNGAAKIATGTFSWTPENKDTSSNLYYFTVGAIDNACPWNSAFYKTYSVRVHAIPQVNIFTPATCFPDTNAFIDSTRISLGYTASRKWLFGDGDSSAVDSLKHLYKSYGSYDVKLSIVSDGGCKNSAVKTVKYSPKPEADFDIVINCREQQDTFFNISIINPDTIVSTLWDFGDRTYSGTYSPVRSYAKPGIYSVKLVTISNNGCSDTIEKTVGEQLFLEKLPDTIVCRGQEVNYLATGTGGDAGRYAFSWDHGLGITQSIQVSPDTTTTYRVVLIDSCNNAPDTGYVTVTVRPPLQIEPVKDTTICLGRSIKLSALASGGFVNGHTLTWDQGLGAGNDFYVSPDTTTTYRVILSDGCTTSPDTGYVTVTVRAALSISPRTDTTICTGQQVVLSASSSGGYTPDHVLSWDNGLGSGNNFNISPAITSLYRVVLSDNCSSKPDTGYVTIRVRAPLDINERQDTFFCNGQGAKLFAEAKGGDSLSYTYTWDQGIGTGNYLMQTPGVTTTYRVIISDNCTVQNDTGYVTLNVRVPLNLVPPNDTLICTGQPISLYVAGTGGDSLYYTYEWDQGLGTGNNKQVAPDTAVTYRVILTDNCTLKADTDFIKITVKPALKVIPRSDTTICAGQSVILSSISAGGNFTGHVFSWDHGLGAGNGFLASPAATTNYRVILSDNCTAKPDTGFVLITVRSALKVIPMADTTICMGQSLDLHASSSGGFAPSHTYSWDKGTGTGNYLKTTPAASTTYSVVLTDNCTSEPDTGFVRVTLRSSLKVTPRNDTLICIGQSVTLSAMANGGFTPAHTFTWDQGLGEVKTFLVSPAVTTTYKVILTDQCTLLPDSGYVTISVRPALKAKPGSDTTICIGQSVKLFSLGSGGYAGTYSFNWESLTAPQTWTSLGNGSQVTVAPVQTALYRVIQSDNCTHLSDTELVKVTVNPPLIADAGADQLICFGQAATISAIGSGGNPTGYVYTWNNGLGDGAAKMVSPKFTTTYRVIITDNCTHRSDTDFVTINVKPQLKVKARPYVKICAGQSVQLYSQGLGGDVPNNQFSWDNGLGSGNNFTVTPAQTTVYTVTLSDGCSIEATDTVTVEVEQLPSADFNAVPQTVCFPDSVFFKNTSQFLPKSMFTWYFGDLKTSSLKDPAHVYPAAGMYDVSLKITSTFGCTDSIFKPGYITVNPKPRAAFSASPDSTSILTPGITFENFSMGAIDHSWDFGDFDGTSGLKNPVYHFTDTGTFRVNLLVTNQFGCTDNSSRNIRIEDVFRFFIPNSFTPNGDNLNDEFAPRGNGFRNYKTQVYNRWGELIFESHDKNVNWNGGFFNKVPALQDGVYIYKIFVTGYDGKPHYFSGTVHILR